MTEQALVAINPLYGGRYRQVRAALAGERLPEAIRRFAVTEHELDVLRALEWLIAANDKAFLKYTPEAAGKKQPSLKVQKRSLAKYIDPAQKQADVLRWTLLLHDLAKEREGAAIVAHPLRGAEIVRLIQAKIWGEAGDLAQLVGWLIKYHDVLGNIYTGERIPVFLLEIGRELGRQSLAEALSLLQIVTLCDLRGTAGGRYLTDDKASYWLRLGDETAIRKMNADLFDWRIIRWTGDLLGVDNRRRATELRALIGQSPARPFIVEAFSARVEQIIYGFYLFTQLPVGQLFRLMEQLSIQVAASRLPRLTLRFSNVFRPGNERLLTSYCQQIEAGHLRFFIEERSQMITVSLDEAGTT